jgi:1-deoxyxylulose-5-phosphate synthase
MTLPTTRLGRTGLNVSRLTLGTMTFGLQCDESTSFRILDAATEGGITLLDTADVYPLGGTLDVVGRTEEIVGRWLKGKRSRYLVATKGAGQMGSAPWEKGNSRKHLLDAIDASLRRLGTDYVDLYQLHHDDHDTPLEESMEALDTIVKSGRARYVGVSNLLAWRVATALGRSVQPARRRNAHRQAQARATAIRGTIHHRDFRFDVPDALLARARVPHH